MISPAERVLLVDDDPGIRRSLARIIRAKGYQVDIACDGESAVSLAREFCPQLLIMDIRMPGIDGVEAFEQIRVDHPDVPAIFMTACSSSHRVARALEIGALSVLPKPLDLERLSSMLENVMPREN